MASGTIYLTTEWWEDFPFQGRVVWTSTADVSGNKSRVTANLQIRFDTTSPGAIHYEIGETSYMRYGMTYYFWNGSLAKDSGELDKEFIVSTSWQTLFTYSGTFLHQSDGTGSAYLDAWIWQQTVGNAGVTKAKLTFDTIAQKATLSSAPNFTDDDNDNPTITYSNPAGNSVTSLQACISLEGDNDDIKYRDISPTGTSYTFVLTEEERELLRQATTGATSRRISFHIKTVLNGTTHYHSLPKTFTVVGAEPTFTVTIRDISNAVDLTNNPDIFISDMSIVSYSIEAEGKKGATISKYEVTHGSETYTGASGTIANLVNGTFEVKVTDNRGNFTKQTVSRSYIAYSKPTCVIEVVDVNTNGNLTFKLSGYWFQGKFGASGVTNSLRYIYAIRDNDGNIAANEGATISADSQNYSVSIDVTKLDYKKGYTIVASVEDLVDYVEATEVKFKIQPVFDWSETDFNFNVPICFNGQEMKDFIIDQGTSGGWTYRLWNSGMAECWRRLQITTPVNTAWGSLYSSGSLSSTNLSYPFEFNEIPVLNVTLMPFGSGGLIMAPGNGYGSVSQTGPFEITRGTSLSSGQFLISYQAIGRWK